MILGATGSGKTTLLNSLASGVSWRQWPEFRHLVPVYARPRLYAHDDDRNALWDRLAVRLAEDDGLRHADGLLTALARDGLLLVLLDGLDEVGEAAAGWLPPRIGELHERLAGRAGLGASRLSVTRREQTFDLLPDAGRFGRHGFGAYRLAELRDGEKEALIAHTAGHRGRPEWHHHVLAQARSPLAYPCVCKP